MRILVTGDRNYKSKDVIWAVLDGVFGVAHSTADQMVLIEGGARGADTFAGEYAEAQVAVEHLRFPADWKKHGRAAGPIRNQQMLDEGKPDLVIAFHDNLADSKGTADMVKRAEKAGIRVIKVSCS